MNQNVMIRKANGALEPFDISKLELSLRRAHATPAVAQQVVEHMIKNIEEGMSTHDIYHEAFSLLNKLERPVAARYSLRRDIMSLGPSGFPFEKFIAEVFKTQGYEAITDQVVLGECVEHEVDVVAWNDDKLMMTEVKFHNELGMKSDLKVVLYVKARFEDLEGTTFDYGGKNRKMTEGLLITNTKFTLSAIKYAECKDMKIIGWNYPIDNSLKDMIDKSGLSPITILNSLSDHDKKALLDKGVVLCTTLMTNPEVLRDLGYSEENIDAVAEEVKQLAVPASVE
jgi:hypothetical protein